MAAATVGASPRWRPSARVVATGRRFRVRTVRAVVASAVATVTVAVTVGGGRPRAGSGRAVRELATGAGPAVVTAEGGFRGRRPREGGFRGGDATRGRWRP